MNNVGISGSSIHERQSSFIPTTNELQTERVWKVIRQSLLQNQWDEQVIAMFKTICAEDEFVSVELIHDDIVAFEIGDSLLMPSMKMKMEWDDETVSKFVKDLRIALTEDMKRSAVDSRTIKRAESSLMERGRSHSISITDGMAASSRNGTPVPMMATDHSNISVASNLSISRGASPVAVMGQSRKTTPPTPVPNDGMTCIESSKLLVTLQVIL